MIALMVLVAATVYLVIGSFIVKRIPNKWGKGVAIIVMLLIPTGDAIVGRIYLNHLCSTEAGVKAYRTVELPAEYWDALGGPKFLASNGFVDMKLLPSKFQWHDIHEPYIDSVIRI